MDKFTYLDNAGAAYVETLYSDYQRDPNSVDEYWQKFFEGYEFNHLLLHGGETQVSNKEVAVVKLINAYRSRGHLISNTNPIAQRRKHRADLELSYFGLSDDDLDTEFEAGSELRIGKATLRQIVAHLQKTYCGTLGVEFMYCRHPEMRQWLYKEMEPSANHPAFSRDEKKRILNKIMQAVQFENFLHTKYVGQKRFSLEGLEALIPALDTLIELGSELGVEELVLGMAHRGRLNVLVNIFQKPYEKVFCEFEGATFEDESIGDGDVKYHMGNSADVTTAAGRDMHLSLIPNPSHLEAVNPVVEGIVYSRKLETHGGNAEKIIPVLIHGDSAIAGQGINYELINMSKLKGYDTGGTIHIVTNNQLGFTTSYLEARSSVYCTDLAKVTESPVFHVNADDPLTVIHAMKMALRLRQKFHIDVYIDIVGYRKYGHNEGDEPRFTQPVMYQNIAKHDNIQAKFASELVESGDIASGDEANESKEFKAMLQKKLDHVKAEKPKLKVDTLGGHWKDLRFPEDADFESSISTGTSEKVLINVAKALVGTPDGFNLYTKMEKLLETRKDLFFTQKKVDWAMAELLAYGSLLLEGHPVRLSGQDAQRGTFTHRHAVIKDTQTEESYTPLNHIQKDQAIFSVYNSLLSEYCVSGFELGYSWSRPNTLVIWEAQFGDFSNGAQIIIDQFIASSASKWQRMSGLVMLLPHGYEGQGPEHSSARLERYLQLCAEKNMYVVNITTPANFFHAIRRQLHNTFRIPLIVMSPKSLLRHPLVISDVSELTKGNFQEIIDDTGIKATTAKKVLVCSGKLYYELDKFRHENKIKDTAIVRFEQLYPLPKKQIEKLHKKYPKAKWVWVQEEPENMGAWSHILRHLPQFNWQCAARKASASTAIGNAKLHDTHQHQLISKAFGL